MPLHAQQGDAVDELLRRLERSRRPATQRAIWGFSTVPPTATPPSNSAAPSFCRAPPAPSCSRDRQPLDGTTSGDGYRLMVQAFVEYGPRARLPPGAST
jgi:hypothetical protein